MYAVEPLGCYAKSNEIHLNKFPTSSNTIVTTSCDSYTFNNQILISSGVYVDTLINTYGCDSIITLYLTINTPNTGITQNSATLTANQNGATYQWIDCSTNTAIIGATNQSYTAINNGNYAVVVTANNCTDTSACILVTTVDILESEKDNLFSIYPNPTNEKFTISLPVEDATITVIDMFGREVIKEQAIQKTIDLQLDNNGVYIVNVITKQGTTSKKLVINR